MLKSGTSNALCYVSSTAKKHEGNLWNGKAGLDDCRSKCVSNSKCKFFSFWGTNKDSGYCELRSVCNHWGSDGNNMVSTYGRGGGTTRRPPHPPIHPINQPPTYKPNNIQTYVHTHVQTSKKTSKQTIHQTNRQQTNEQTIKTNNPPNKQTNMLATFVFSVSYSWFFLLGSHVPSLLSHPHHGGCCAQPLVNVVNIIHARTKAIMP